MILDANNNQEHELYVKAIKSLNSNNMYSEYRKVPNTSEERAFMQETNHVCASSSFGMNMSEEQYQQIFKHQEK